MPNTHDGYYKIVKLKTGENILCSMDRDIKSPASETHLHLTIPVQVVPMKEMRKGNHVVGESFMLRPWMGLSNGEEFTISTDVVLTIGDLKKEVKQQYVNYISQARETRQRIEDQEAAEELLREVSNGELRIVEIDEYYGDDYGEEEG